MKKVLRFSLALAVGICLSLTVALGQGKIAGKVASSTGEPLSFSIIYVPKTNFGANSDANGNFQINKIPAGTYQLIASYVGFKKQQVEVKVTDNETTTVNFVLSEDTSANEVIVTGTVNPKTALESSISISTLKANQIAETAPRSTAEILRAIPGVRSEASAGEGNTNITVRGVPIATGGSKFLLLQEDGLPVLQFGDIAFATADIFMRADNTVGRVEALRGGSASTLASNSPAGVINFISKTGNTAGGSVATSLGLDYRNFRTDFEYGSPIANGWNFHLGGFYRQGDGPRTTNFTSSNGGQFKANLTKNFEKGYARIYLKVLDDRTPAYMPMPIQVTGTNDNPTWTSVSNYSALKGALQSPGQLNLIGTGPDGNLRRSSVADGINPVTTALGSEMSFELGEGWHLTNKNRYAINSGSFTSPFPAQVGDATSIANSIGGAGAKLTYANGTAFPANANGNGLLARIHMFDTKLNNMNNFTNDINLNKTFGQLSVNGGIYKAYQNISMSWLWNSYLTDVNDAGAQLVNVTNAAGDTSFTDNGTLAYGTPFWGNLHRNYDTHYDITAPYAGAEFKATDKITIDVSGRYDYGKVFGSYSGGSTKALDVDGDGKISYVEQKVEVMNNTKPSLVNYSYDYFSYSAGLNYLLKDNMAVFARTSKGARANADRLLFGSYILPDGSAAAGLKSDVVKQSELGLKYRKQNFTINATAFFASVEEQNFEATTQKSVNRTYTAKGLELDGSVTSGNFTLRGGVTFTDAKIKKDEINKASEGKTPRRQAPYIFQIMPSYKYKKHAIGISAIGTGKSFAQDNNELVMPGYVYFNGFINLGLSSNMTLSFNGNNLFNTIGITEAEEGSIVNNTTNIVRGRSIAGRTISATLRVNF